ncbi:hypothetical protein ACL02U_11470 [Streptomyces sp. MS06]|uniref:hypothetical protein n=1 Tax=Streptomyces sp. MS06 TaxID=3385974 RepID=UPI0039A33889
MIQSPRETVAAAMAEMAVLRALQVAGRRLLARRSRVVRGPLRTVPPWELHVHLPVGDTDLALLLRDAWVIPEAVGLPSTMIEALDQHVRILLAAGLGYRRDDLFKTLRASPDVPHPMCCDRCRVGGLDQADPGAAVHGLILVAVRRMRRPAYATVLERPRATPADRSHTTWLRSIAPHS